MTNDNEFEKNVDEHTMSNNTGAKNEQAIDIQQDEVMMDAMNGDVIILEEHVNESVSPEETSTIKESYQEEVPIAVEPSASVIQEEILQPEEASAIKESYQEDAPIVVEPSTSVIQEEILQPEEVSISAGPIASVIQQEIPQQEEESLEGGKKGKKKQNKTKKDQSFGRRHRNAIVLSGCLLLSLGGGFGGTLLAVKLSGANGKTVLYQSVNNDKNTTASAKNVSITNIANETMNSVVEIKTESVSTADYFQQAVVSGAGSGVILSADGYIVTNNHVIDGANKITVTTKDGKSYEAELIGTDSATDLAVIKIEVKNLTPVIMGDSSKLKVGDTAVAIGNPLGSLGGTVTNGIISALDREVTIDNQKMHLLQTSAAINPGNSGGGLFNDQGELIGIVNAKSSGDDIEGLGFAIPMNRAKDIITNLIENGYVKGRASLGITLTTGNSRFSTDEASQVYVYKVESGKAADKAGLKYGDQILKIDGEEINDVSDVTSIISSHSSGDKIKITVLRDNETKTLTVTLGEADASSSSTTDDESQQQDQIPGQN